MADRDPEDARDAYVSGADGIVVSNSRWPPAGRCMPSARAFAIADAVKGDISSGDSGNRNGLDVVRMIALGASLLGRAFLHALATAGRGG